MDTAGVDFIHWPGVACSAVGGLFWLVGWAKGKQSRQLESATPVDRLSDVRKLAGMVPLLVAVTGRAQAEKPLVGELTNEPCVITEVREEQQMSKRQSNNRWVRDSSTLRHTRLEAPWALADASSAQLPIIDALNAHLTLPVVVEAYTDGPKRGLLQTGLDAFAGFHILGHTVTERSLPVGTPLTAVGELARAPSGSVACAKAASAGADGVLVLRSPRQGDAFFITTQPLPDLISSISGVAKTCKWLAVGFGAVGAALVAWRFSGGVVTLLRRKRLRTRVEAANRRLEEARRAGNGIGIADTAEAPDTGDRDANLCAVCLENSCTAVFAACGHMCTCWDCAQRMDKCPLCRSRTHAIRVYRP